LNDILVHWDCELGESTVVSHIAWWGREICPAIVIEASAEHSDLLLEVLLKGDADFFSVVDGADEPHCDSSEEFLADVGMAGEEVARGHWGNWCGRGIDPGGSGGLDGRADGVDLGRHSLWSIVVAAIPFFAKAVMLGGVDVGRVRATPWLEVVELVGGVRPIAEQILERGAFTVFGDSKGDVERSEIQCEGR
jgi:hypothetical protein